MRPAEDHGARALQAVHLQQARGEGVRHHHQEREEDGGEGAPRGLGHPRRGDPRAPGAAEPRPDAPPPRHPGVRAGPHRGQGDPAPPARLHRLQRRLRRRSDGRARAALHRGPDGGARAHDEHEQHPLARARQADHRAVAGHRPRHLLHDPRARVRERRGQGLREPGGGPRRLRPGRGRAPGEDLGAHGRQAGRDDRRPRPALRHRAEAAAVRVHQQGDGQEAAPEPHRPHLPALRREGDRPPRRPRPLDGLRQRHQGRHLHRPRRHGDPAEEAGAARARHARGRRHPDPVHRGSHHHRRAVQQGHRHLGPGHRGGGPGDDGRDRPGDGDRAEPRGQARGAQAALVQPDLHHGRLGRPRLGAADPAARRHARPHGEAVGRDHRDPDHRELPRGPERPPVLHLDARRPQGPRRHGAQDRELRLPDPPPRRRRAGRDHHRVRLRRDGRDHPRRPRRGRRDHRADGRAHPRPRRARRHPRSVQRRGAREGERGDRRGQGQAHRERRHRQGEDPLGAHLPGPARHLRRVLRPRPRARAQGEHRRGGRRHRRPVDRRAGHAAHDADLPHRRRGLPARGAVDPREPEPRRS